MTDELIHDILRAVPPVHNLQAGRDANFERLARLATDLLDVPIAIVAVTNGNEQVVKGTAGLRHSPEVGKSLREYFWGDSAGNYTDESLAYRDVREEPVTINNSALRHLGVVAYLDVYVRDGDGQVQGALCAIDDKPRTWGAADVSRLQDLARAAMTEVALVGAVQKERTFRSQSLAANEQLRQLIGIGSVLSGSLDYEETLDNILHLLVPAYADWCVMDLVRGNQVRRVSLTTLTSDNGSSVRALEEFPPRLEAAAGVGLVLRSGVTHIVPFIDSTYLDEIGQTPKHRQLLDRVEAKSAAIVPMHVGRKVTGSLLFVSSAPDRYEEDSIPFLEEVANRVGLAIDSAWLYRDRDRVASTLQASLIPSAVQSPPGFEAAARYHAARGGSQLGGDFYDLFDVRGGQFMAVIGDVRGKGVGAAALTGIARHTIRGAALSNPDPVHVLRTLNNALLMEVVDDTKEDPLFCTAAAVLITPAHGQASLSVASAGHPPVLVVRAGGGVDELGADGTLLGVLKDLEISQQQGTLYEGDTMLLHTDGVTDARAATDEFFGEARLHAALRPAPLGAEATVQRVTDAAMSWQSGVARDDMAVLALSLLKRNYAEDQVQSIQSDV